jgi:hypothetical protein
MEQRADDDFLDGDFPRSPAGPPPLMDCSWPGCTATGDPWEDNRWCWWPRQYLWLDDGFFCPIHDQTIKDGIAMGAFDDWPLDLSPEVLAFQEWLHQCHHVNSPEGREALRRASLPNGKSGGNDTA